jgi:hypothetical protein
LTYEIDNTHAAFFAIDMDTGQLKTADSLVNPLDYEKQTDYEVTVIATDKAIPLPQLKWLRTQWQA